MANKFIAYARYTVRIEPLASFDAEARQGLSTETLKPYKINDKSSNQGINLRHGRSVKLFPMDRVSNTPFQMVGGDSFPGPARRLNGNYDASERV
jgi:hypothetical protein